MLDDDDSRPLRWLCISATALVALTFLIAGLQKLIHPDAGVTMLARYAGTSRAVIAVGCVELAIGLWLASFRYPRSAGLAAIATLALFTGLIGLELRRSQPLPCGCMPSLPGAVDPQTVRRELWIAVGRNGFLIALAALSAGLARKHDDEISIDPVR